MLQLQKSSNTRGKKYVGFSRINNWPTFLFYRSVNGFLSSIWVFYLFLVLRSIRYKQVNCVWIKPLAKQPFMLQKTTTKKTRKRKNVESRKRRRLSKRLDVRVFNTTGEIAILPRIKSLYLNKFDYFKLSKYILEKVLSLFMTTLNPNSL